MSDLPYSAPFRRPYEHSVQAVHACPHCAKEYTSIHHLTAHQRNSCVSSKRGLSELLDDTRNTWEARKRARVQARMEVQEPVPADPRGSSQRGTSTPTPAVHPENRPVIASNDLEVPVAQRKHKRARRLPSRYVQSPSPPPRERQKPPPTAQTTKRLPQPPTPPPPVLVVHESVKDVFGVVRRYLLQRKTTPSPAPPQSPSQTAPSKPPAPAKTTYGPFSSKTAFLLAEWYWDSKNKSFRDFQRLISIFSDQAFSLNDALDVNWKSAFELLGADREDSIDHEASWMADDGWKTATISLDVPFHRLTKDPGTKRCVVGEFRYRTILSVVKEKLSCLTDGFHYYPYKATWKRAADSPAVELYGELYASRRFCEENDALQRQPPGSRDAGLERVIVALMFWSDSTQLTSFGGATLWPCYMFFGNDSKYERDKPSARLGNQIAYFLKFPDSLNDYLKERNGGKLPSDHLFKYLKRQLFHKQWSVLVDAELIDAMKNGIVVAGPDGRPRCFFPRIFSYAADYPEKALISGIRNNGTRPCHRCFVEKRNLCNLGSSLDIERLDNRRTSIDQRSWVSKAQGLIRAGYAVNTDAIEDELGPKSLVPVKSSFDPLLSAFQFDILSTLAVDILHEFEIGVWKRLYVHFIRLLNAFTGRNTNSLAAELDWRYRQTPPFGRDTIRKFPLNASEMKRKAARDFEDLLQCAIPAFEGLLPEPHNQQLMELLFVCAQWHALAKLRLHNDLTLDLLEYTTTHLGAQVRSFQRSCSTIPTKETKKEAEARARKAAKKRKEMVGGAARKPAALSVFTIKFHFLGDYVSTIRQLGTTDSYSTQTGELYHREPKSWYPRTDRKAYEVQISRIERRRARLACIRALQISGRDPKATPSTTRPDEVGSGESVPDPCYSVGSNQNSPIGLRLLAESNDDPGDDYASAFIPKLKQHLWPRLLDQLGCSPQSSVVGTDPWTHIVFQGSRIYSHKILRVVFTAYDTTQEQDVIHVDTAQCNIMKLNEKYTEATRHSTHPYTYGKVLGVFHADVSFAGQFPPGATDKSGSSWRLDFVWVNWYDHIAPKAQFALDRVSLRRLDSNSPGEALGFVDPAEIVRAVHLIPQFSLGKYKRRNPTSRLVKEQDIWEAYYVNRFVDRDAFMRYQYGMSVGHKYTHTSAFPPSLPSIPPGFDHCVSEIDAEVEAYKREKAMKVRKGKQKVVGVENASKRIGFQSGDGEDGSDQEGGHSEEEGEESECGERDEEEGGSEDEDGSEDGDESESEDEEDDLDDQELLAYDDMFGSSAA